MRFIGEGKQQGLTASKQAFKERQEIQRQVTWKCQAEGLWLVLRKISGLF